MNWWWFCNSTISERFLRSKCMSTRCTFKPISPMYTSYEIHLDWLPLLAFFFFLTRLCLWRWCGSEQPCLQWWKSQAAIYGQIFFSYTPSGLSLSFSLLTCGFEWQGYLFGNGGAWIAMSSSGEVSMRRLSKGPSCLYLSFSLLSG